LQNGSESQRKRRRREPDRPSRTACRSEGTREACSTADMLKERELKTNGRKKVKEGWEDWDGKCMSRESAGQGSMGEMTDELGKKGFQELRNFKRKERSREGGSEDERTCGLGARLKAKDGTGGGVSLHPGEATQEEIHRKGLRS